MFHRHTTKRHYSFQNGELTRVHSIGYSYHFGTQYREPEEIFSVDGEEVDAEVYNQISDRFIPPADEYFFFW